MPGSSDPFPQDDAVTRGLQENQSAMQRQLDDLIQLLRPYTEERFSAFNETGQPFNWAGLLRNDGAWPGITASGPSTLAALQPGADVSTHSDPKYTITYGTFGGPVPTIGSGGPSLVPTTALNIITLGTSDTMVYIKCDYTFTTAGIKTIVDCQLLSGTSLPTSTISTSSGTLYDEIFGVTITAPVGSGPYTVVAAPAVGGSQDFGICIAGPSINGAWRT